MDKRAFREARSPEYKLGLIDILLHTSLPSDSFYLLIYPSRIRSNRMPAHPIPYLPNISILTPKPPQNKLAENKEAKRQIK
jgi:hypothetical protein